MRYMSEGEWEDGKGKEWKEGKGWRNMMNDDENDDEIAVMGVMRLWGVSAIPGMRKSYIRIVWK